MTNHNLTSNLKNGLLQAVLFFIFAASAVALPGTGSTNLQTTPGVTFSQTGSTLTFNAPDRAILNWNNFGSGADQIAVADTLRYNLPGAAASVLNIVSGGVQTTINGTIESNGKVYVLNPNGILIGSASRIDTAAFVASAVDNPFAAQFKYMSDGVIPSEVGGQRTASGNVTVVTGAIIATPNVTIYGKDITIGAVLTGGSLNLVGDGAVTVGAPVLTTLVSGDLTVTNPTGTTTLGTPTGTVIANGNISAISASGDITNAIGSRLSAKNLTVATTTGNVGLAAVSAPAVSATGKNVSVAFDGGVISPAFSGAATTSLTVTSPGFLTLANVTGNAASNTFTAGSTLTLGRVHLGGSASFTGSRVVDSLDGVFVYDRAAFTATAGDVAVTKANHSFGPLSISATGNATVYENGTINLNVVNVKDLVLKTNGGFFQTPVSFGLVANKLSLDTRADVAFLGGNVANGLTITAGAGNVDLSKLNLVTNLNSVAPTVTTTGTITNPAQ